MPKKKTAKTKPQKVLATPVRRPDYAAIFADVVGLLEQARSSAARAVNVVMTTTYWHVGRRIMQEEQLGRRRAGYGDELIIQLSVELTRRFGRGFSYRNLNQMRAFYNIWPNAIATKTSSQQSSDIVQTSSAQFISLNFQLPWSHYVELLRIENPLAREFYETEALRGGWTVKQIRRQIGTQFYERTAMSRNKLAMLTKHAAAKPEDATTPEEEIKDPFVLEFLGLKDEYSELELEDAIIRHLESFLLELGNDFAFVGRQRRLRIGDSWFRVDLLFFHRRLKCLVIIDLKTGKFTAGDAGQMHLYCNYAAEHWTQPDERPPVGLILCDQADSAVARYALDGLPNRIMAAEYRAALPDEQLLADEIVKTRRLFESRPERRSS
jgi:predicted nuclease of restriction endonuclease-like (RecB) superfamily